MSDYIFPEAVVAALVALAGSAISVDAALTVDPTRLHVSMDAEVFRREFGQTLPNGHRITIEDDEDLSYDFQDIDGLVVGENEWNPIFAPESMLLASVFDSGGAPDEEFAGFEFFNMSSRFLLDGKATREFIHEANIMARSGEVFTSNGPLVFQGEALIDGRRDSIAVLRLTDDVVFSNGGDVEWILAAGAELRMSFVPTPAAATPLLAGLVAVRRRR